MGYQNIYLMVTSISCSLLRIHIQFFNITNQLLINQACDMLASGNTTGCHHVQKLNNIP